MTKRLITIEINFDPEWDRMSSIAEQLLSVIDDDRYLSSYVSGLRFSDNGSVVTANRRN